MNETTEVKSQQQVELDRRLYQFIGTEQYFRHPSGFLFTDGVKYLAEHYGTFWLLDTILFNQPLEIDDLQVWKLKRTYDDKEQPTDRFILTGEDGNRKIAFTAEIPYSDFPADEVTIWFQNGVLYLPSEH